MGFVSTEITPVRWLETMMAATVPRCGGALIASALNRSRKILPTLFSSTSLGGHKFRSHSRPYPHPAYCSTTEVCSSEVSPTPPPPAAAAVDETDPVVMEAGKLDLRVGRILRAWRHPEADSLYVEEVDVGEEEPRTICSGLVDYIPLEHLQDIMVVVLANLKPRNMRGVKSNGMLMAASDVSHENVELLLPPEGSVTGERIWFGADEEKAKQPDPAPPNQVQKKKIWESIQPHLKTTDSCIAVLGQQHPMRTSAGVVACKSLKNANIS